MSSQPTSPAAVLSSSQQQQQQQQQNHHLHHHHHHQQQQAPSSPHSRADSAVRADGSRKGGGGLDSSFTSNSSERHPKGKRKRTAVKDKAILESAYNANPKPDKAARLDIVERVSLNEKEVQIWFQNRRQNDRRKSRPLSPQEIAALQYGSMQVLPECSSIGLPPPPPSSRRPTPRHVASPLLQSSSPAAAPERADASAPSTIAIADHGRRPPDPQMAVEARDRRRESAASLGMPAGSASQPTEFTATAGPPATLCRSNSVGYFAARLHAGPAFQSIRRSPDSYRHEFMPAPRPSSAAPGSVLPPPQLSKYRLSMSVEGKAELVPQPSPRLSPSLSDSFVPPDRPQLYRSHSAADSVTLPPISTFAAPFEAPVAPAAQSQVLLQPQPRLPPRGLCRSRSRDVHAWEMACQANSGEHRDELAVYAERESSGSATAAISLLRTLSSSSHPLSPISRTGHVFQSNSTTKRNARPSAQHQPRHAAKKPKLRRATAASSAARGAARVPTDFAPAARPTGKPPTRRPDANTDADDGKKARTPPPPPPPLLLLSPGGRTDDSDKENWTPAGAGRRGGHSLHRLPAGRRPLPSAPPQKTTPVPLPPPAPSLRRRALRDSTNHRAPRVRGAGTPARPRRRKALAPISIFEDGGDGGGGGDDDDDDDGGLADASDSGAPRRPEPTDDEVERFMCGAGVSPGKKGAAGAIAGLLALSQGAWW